MNQGALSAPLRQAEGRRVWTRRRLLSLALGVMCLLALGWHGPATADPATTITLSVDSTRGTVNGDTVYLDSAPVVVSDRTFVPVRFIGETLGAYVAWDGINQKVTYLTGDTKIELWIDSTRARVNGSSVTLDAAPYVDGNGRTLVPARFVSEQFGAKVGWEQETRTLTITAPWVGQVVTLQDAKFSPRYLTVAAGTRITWVNLDTMSHNVSHGDFASGTMSYMAAYSYTFNKAGTYNYQCTFHPGMDAQVIVK